jgi:sarcosine oxidase
MQGFDLIVVGAGVMGCATAYQAARAGRSVLLIEQYRIGHTQGSSHGPSRIIRLAYTSVHYSLLCRAAFQAWRDVEVESGERLLVTTGGLDFGTPGISSLEKTYSSLRTAGVPFEEMDYRAIVKRFPQFSLPRDVLGIYQPDAAILDADRCVATLARLAERCGATIAQETKVERFQATTGGVVVHTKERKFFGSKVVVAAGSWLAILVAHLGLELPLRVSKEQVAYFKPRHPQHFAVGRLPVMIEHCKNCCFRSGFPLYRSEGVKMMIESKVAPMNSEEVDAARLEELEEYARTLFPDLGAIVKAQVCRYTMTPDENFILDQHPEFPQIVLASPCSGHGFKFAALLGTILHDLAFERPPTHDIQLFRIKRAGLVA